jgi:hypothetical protein
MTTWIQILSEKGYSLGTQLRYIDESCATFELKDNKKITVILLNNGYDAMHDDNDWGSNSSGGTVCESYRSSNANRFAKYSISEFNKKIKILEDLANLGVIPKLLDYDKCPDKFSGHKGPGRPPRGICFCYYVEPYYDDDNLNGNGIISISKFIEDYGHKNSDNAKAVKTDVIKLLHTKVGLMHKYGIVHGYLRRGVYIDMNDTFTSVKDVIITNLTYLDLDRNHKDSNMDNDYDGKYGYRFSRYLPFPKPNTSHKI